MPNAGVLSPSKFYATMVRGRITSTQVSKHIVSLTTINPSKRAVKYRIKVNSHLQFLMFLLFALFAAILSIVTVDKSQRLYWSGYTFKRTINDRKRYIHEMTSFASELFLDLYGYCPRDPIINWPKFKDTCLARDTCDHQYFAYT